MGTEWTYVEIVEAIRAVMAAYTQALDDGRTDDVVATFCTDGFCDMPGLGHHVGHDALRRAYGQLKPAQPQRHLVMNTLVTGWNDHEARATSDVVFLSKDDPGWAVQLVGRYHDVLHCDGEIWRFHSRVAEFTT